MGQDTERQQKKTEPHTNQAVSEHDNSAECQTETSSQRDSSSKIRPQWHIGGSRPREISTHEEERDRTNVFHHVDKTRLESGSDKRRASVAVAVCDLLTLRQLSVLPKGSIANIAEEEDLAEDPIGSWCREVQDDETPEDLEFDDESDIVADKCLQCPCDRPKESSR